MFLVWLFLSASVIKYGSSTFLSGIAQSDAERPDGFVWSTGRCCAYALAFCFGRASRLVVLGLGAGLLFYWFDRRVSSPWTKTLGLALLLVSASGFSAYVFEDSVALVVGSGGCVGAIVKYFFDRLFVRAGAYLALLGAAFSGLILILPSSVLRLFFWTLGLSRFLSWASRPFRQRIVDARPGGVDGSRRFAPETTSARGGFDAESKRAVVDFARAPSVRTVELDAPQVAPTRPSAPVVSFGGDPFRAPTQDPRVLSQEAREEERENSPREPKRSLFNPFGFGAKKNVDFEQNVPSNVSDDSSAENARDVATRSEVPSQFESSANSESSNEVLSVAPDALDPRFDDYQFPSFDLLEPAEEFDRVAFEEQISARGVELERVCKSFGVDLKVADVRSGPVLTLYEIELKEGLRVKKLYGLTNDLAIKMKVPSVRVVSPIPGKNTVGVELPNERRQLVRLREVMESCADEAKNMSIPIFLGKDVVGAPMVADLAKLPHLLIAGRTGTGKSVCLNSIIMSIVTTRSPKQVKLIMIDPKMVELSPYKTIPHLMHPVVVDMEKAAAILEWAVEKMERRYQIFASVGARQLSEFNSMPLETMRKRLQPADEEEWACFPKSMPSVVIIADEMADLIMTAGKDVERHIARLAQKSRAVGIHLVLATQKPTVDVVTGLIKSNLPARIAFGVASRVDSQVVLDANGAEQLLGNGDMLFLLPGTSQLVRGQGTYVSNQEIDRVIDAISVETPRYEIEIAEKEDEGGAGEGDARETEFDEYYVPAVDLVISEGRASTSMLQRKFSIGYSRAARIIDTMASEGLISPFNPAKPSRPRDVLISMEEWRGKQTSDETAPRENASTAPKGFYSPQDYAPHADGLKGAGPTFNDAPVPYATPPIPRADGNMGAVASLERPRSTIAPPSREFVASVVAQTRESKDDGYRSTSYENAPIQTNRAHSVTQEDSRAYDEFDLSPSKNGSNSRNDAPESWNDAQFEDYLNCDDEIDGRSSSTSSAIDDYSNSNGYNGVNLREIAKNRRFNRESVEQET